MKHPAVGPERPKILLFAGTILALALVVASIAVVALILVIGLTRDHSELAEHNVPYAVAVSSAALNAKAMANHERGFLISGQEQFVREIEQSLADVRIAFGEAAVAADDDRERQAAAKAEAGFERWVAALQRQLRMYRQGDRAAATREALGPGRALRKNYEAAFADAQRVAATEIDRRRHAFASSGWLFIVLASLIVVLAIGLGTTFWLIHSLRLPSSDAALAAPANSPLSLVAPPERQPRRQV